MFVLSFLFVCLYNKDKDMKNMTTKNYENKNSLKIEQLKSTLLKISNNKYVPQEVKVAALKAKNSIKVKQAVDFPATIMASEITSLITANDWMEVDNESKFLFANTIRGVGESRELRDKEVANSWTKEVISKFGDTLMVLEISGTQNYPIYSYVPVNGSSFRAFIDNTYAVTKMN